MRLSRRTSARLRARNARYPSSPGAALRRPLLRPRSIRPVGLLCCSKAQVIERFNQHAGPAFGGELLVDSRCEQVEVAGGEDELTAGPPHPVPVLDVVMAFEPDGQACPPERRAPPSELEEPRDLVGRVEVVGSGDGSLGDAGAHVAGRTVLAVRMGSRSLTATDREGVQTGAVTREAFDALAAVGRAHPGPSAPEEEPPPVTVGTRRRAVLDLLRRSSARAARRDLLLLHGPKRAGPACHVLWHGGPIHPPGLAHKARTFS